MSSVEAPKLVVAGIFIAPTAGAPMESLTEVIALEGFGLAGDRYAKGEGHYSPLNDVPRDVTLISAEAFLSEANQGLEKPYDPLDVRRNLVVDCGIEDLKALAEGRTVFGVGAATLRGAGVCSTCMRPPQLSHKSGQYLRVFGKAAGIRAKVWGDGLITADPKAAQAFNERIATILGTNS